MKVDPNEPPRDLGKKKYPSSIEVAKLAGVSQSAVSRTFTQGASVSKATRTKVEKAAAKLGYRPSAIPRIMFTHRSNLVALAVGGLYNPMMAALLNAYTVRLQNAGLQVLLFNVEGSESLDEYIPRIASYRVDAIFITRCIVSKQAAEECDRFNIPIISFYTPRQSDHVSSVYPDDHGGGTIIAEHFLKLGAKKFGFLGASEDNVASRARMLGFQSGLARARGSVDRIAFGAFRYRSGYEAALEMFKGRRWPDALFCASDLIAFGAMDALRKLEIRVPEDVMVAGFDDIPQAAWDPYSLTTLRQNIEATVDKSFDLFQRLMRRELKRGVRELIPVTLVERGSTALRVETRQTFDLT